MNEARERIPLLVICGPTASGKTRLAIDLAKGFDGEVVSADSMQVYRRMDIGTAKPDQSERDGVPHHLIDILEPWEEFSLADYLKLAHSAAADIYGRGKLPVLAGGTGMYMQSLVDNVQMVELPYRPEVREELMRTGRERGGDCLWELLRQSDPEAAERLHPNDQGRVIRALEVGILTGTPMSELQRSSRLTPSPYRPCMLGLAFRDRQQLYSRIDARVDEMIDKGLVEEVRGLARGPLSGTAIQAIGYKELFAHLKGEAGLRESIDRIKMSSRRYAKRQLTWLRGEKRIHWLEWEQFADYGGLLRDAAQTTARVLDLSWKGALSP